MKAVEMDIRRTVESSVSIPLWLIVEVSHADFQSAMRLVEETTGLGINESRQIVAEIHKAKDYKGSLGYELGMIRGDFKCKFVD